MSVPNMQVLNVSTKKGPKIWIASLYSVYKNYKANWETLTTNELNPMNNVEECVDSSFAPDNGSLYNKISD